MFIVSVTYKVEVSKVDVFMDDHMAWLESYYEKGNFIASGRKVPRTGGIIFARAESRETLNAILAEDPFCIQKLVDYDIVEFVPSKAANGFEGLINI